MDASQIAKLPPHQLKQVLLYLYGYQTPEEQVAHRTDNLNGVGFNMIDADILTSFSEQVITGRELSDRQYNIARLRLGKYWRQLEDNKWEKIVLPEVTHTNGSTKSDYSKVTIAFGGAKLRSQPEHKSPGRLELDTETGGLAFYPNVYPSRQIKDIGFPLWKNGAWRQARPRVLASVVEDVKKMFGDIQITAEVTEAISPKPARPLPSWVREKFPTLHEFQLEAIQVTSSSHRLLLALAPRLGKTVVSVISADVIQAKRILVIAPLSLLRDWKAKIQRWSPSSEVAIVYKKNLAVPSRWTVTNYDTLRLHPDTFSSVQWDLVIVDETLLIKNRKAQRTQWIYELINKKLPFSKKREKEASQEPQISIFAGKTKPPEYVWFLSGAPTSRLYTDLWAQLNILAPREFTSYWKFAEEYCINQPNAWTRYNIVANKPDAAEQLKSNLAHVYYTRSHADVTAMPPLEPESLSVAMDPYQDKMYGDMETAFLADLPEDGKLVATNILAQMTRLVQIASNPLLVGGKDSSPKWAAVVEMLQYEERPIIVWTSFVETVKELGERLKDKDMKVAFLTGATKQENRGKIQQDFQNGEVDVLVAHPAVGKYGLDLFNARSVIYMERNYSADDYYQSLMRVRHVDQTVAPHIVHLLSVRKDGGETIDHVIDKILQTRVDATKQLTTARLREIISTIEKGSE